MNNFAKKRDITIIAIILLVFILLYFILRDNEVGDTVEITVDNERTHSVLLNEAQIITLDEQEVVIEIADGKVRFVSSDCPDQVCVHTGEISKVGQHAACLPNRVVVSVIGSGDANLDIII